MVRPSIKARLLLTLAVLIVATALLHAASRRATAPQRRPLRDIPTDLHEWRGIDLPVTRRILNAAGVDDYLDRQYTDGHGKEVDIYIGFYTNQRSGDQIHSPRNCLPAAGWEIMRARRLTLDLRNGPPIMINDVVIVKGLEQQLVFYWYQARGRVIASEYSAKFWMIADALTRNRTDGALVRVVTPIEDQEAVSQLRLVSFLNILYPSLNDFIPN